MIKQKFVIFIRVSTRFQQEYGISQDAQRTSCQEYARRVDGDVVAEFCSQEHGGRSEKQRALHAALKVCREQKAVLLVAVMDRISRDAPFLMNLWRNENKFVVVSMPELNDLTVGILAVVAQHEREMISKRTQAALQEKKRQGVLLGAKNPKWKLTQGGRDRKAAARRRSARDQREANIPIKQQKCRELLDLIMPHLLMAGGTYVGAAELLNEANVPTLSGRGRWHAPQVRDVILTAAPNTAKVVEERRSRERREKAMAEFLSNQKERNG